MKISLVYPSSVQPLISGFFHPPLGLAYIAAVLREAGHVVNIIDLNFCVNWKQLEAELSKAKPDAVGISCMTTMMSDALKVAELVKRSLNCPVILGGPHPTILPEDTLLNENVDYVVEGEGEITMGELIHNLEERKNVKTVSGVWYKEDGIIKRTNPRSHIENLDQIPFPARDLLSKEYFRYGYADVIASRGCPFNCSFCQPTLRRLFGPKVRFRSPANIVNEMEYLKQTIKIKHVKFVDDTFGINRHWISELCLEMKKKSLDLTWDCNSRVNIVSKDLLLMMKKAGCTKISFGVESGSQEILDFLNKGTTIQQILNAFRICKEVGVRTHAYLMIGSPGETEKTITETKSLINKINPDEIYISITTPLPKTKLYDDLVEKGLVTAKTWEDFDYYKKCLIKLENLAPSEILEMRRRITRNFWLRKILQPTYIISTIKMYPSFRLWGQRLKLVKQLLSGG